MPKLANNNRAIMLAVTTALATTALAGCATHAAPPATLSATQAQAALAKGQAGNAVTHAEAAVQAEPRNAGFRAMLGAAYLEAGRFQSAATSFKDAMTLGDQSPRTALSYALAEIGAGNSAAALATLNDYRDSIDPSDLGLALALAGDPGRGVHVLGNALRNGQNTPKVRQNLAYSYALAGDWRSARLMAAEDVPADQINDRIEEWAQSAHPDAFQQRVATLLSVPMVADSGQPAALALGNNPGTDQLAAEASAAGTSVAVAAPAASTGYELPPLGQELPAAGAAPSAAPAQVAVAPSAAPRGFADAFAGGAQAAPAAARQDSNATGFVSQPVVQKTPAVAAKAQPRGAAPGEHLVQLGSFSSEAGAKRAWGIYAARYPQLASYDMVITKAVVRGKTYYRVSAGGLQRAEATSVCSTVRSARQGCIAWAAERPLPGAVDTGVRMARRD